MKISSNTIITVIIAFLIGILAVSAINKNNTPTDVNTDPTSEENVTVGEDVKTEDETTNKKESVEGEDTNTPNTSPAPNTITKQEPTYNNGSCTPNISGSKDAKLNAIVINWTECNNDEFQFYKILRSSKHSNPTYKVDPVLVSSSNKSLTNHVDKTIVRAVTYYYRACVVHRLGKVNCGNIISVKN